MSDENIENPADRRRYTRYEATQKAEVFFDPERKLIADIIDLSYEGVCIEAASNAFEHMLPAMDSSGGYDKVPLRLCFDVIKGNYRGLIQLLVSTVYLKSISDDKSQMGLDIIDVEDGILELSDYISQLEDGLLLDVKPMG
ncbi:hypothetical protein [Dasania marina]|uniref:hypothetical protein n=1 Tax=Dasania marina TaxID=471499 RepID=UPI0030DC9689|tara:strand:+ start:6681 stop:7103 length:423 start_codon:yes stop_codon:yes gene_type:complete